MLLVVGDSGHSILTPPVGTRSRLIVREVRPSVSIMAVVLPHSSPLPFAHIRAPFLPGRADFAGFIQPFLLSAFDVGQGGHGFARGGHKKFSIFAVFPLFCAVKATLTPARFKDQTQTSGSYPRRIGT